MKKIDGKWYVKETPSTVSIYDFDDVTPEEAAQVFFDAARVLLFPTVQVSGMYDSQYLTIEGYRPATEKEIERHEVKLEKERKRAAEARKKERAQRKKAKQAERERALKLVQKEFPELLK